MRRDERTVKYRRTLWKGRPCHASVLPFVTIRPVKTRAAANHGSQYDTEKNNGGCGRPSEDPRREKRLQYPEFGRCRGHGSFRGRRQREDTKWVLAISRDSINLFFFFPLPLPLRNVPRKACWRAILHDRVRTLSFSYYTYEHTIRNMMLACKHETRWKGISNSNIPPPDIGSKRVSGSPVSEFQAVVIDPSRRPFFLPTIGKRSGDDRWETNVLGTAEPLDIPRPRNARWRELFCGRAPFVPAASPGTTSPCRAIESIKAHLYSVNCDKTTIKLKLVPCPPGARQKVYQCRYCRHVSKVN